MKGLTKFIMSLRRELSYKLPKVSSVFLILALLLCTSTSVHALLFDFSDAGPTVTEGGITSTATAIGGTLFSNDKGYGVTGHGTNEINSIESLEITFSEIVGLDSILFTNSNGGNNDLVEMLIDGTVYDFTPAFGNNHPEEMTARSTKVGTNMWLVGFLGLDVVGSTFEFAIPDGSQADGTGGSEYTIGSMDISSTPTPEPTTMLLFGIGLISAGLVRSRKKS